ncbi:hypothetical protein [Mesorhizobium sp. A623]
MQSNFGHARELLEQAWLHLQGDDETSVKSRLAIDILVEAVARAEHSKPYRQAEIVDFRTAERRS